MKKMYILLGFFFVCLLVVWLFSPMLENGNSEVNAENENDEPKESEFIIDGILQEKEIEIERLVDGYQDIIKEIQDYKFPTDGVVEENRTTISYDNGYDLFKLGMGFSVTYDSNIGPQEPTKEQYLPVIVGLIHSTYNTDVYEWEDMNQINLYVEGTMEQLNQAKVYAEEHPPFLIWLDDTIGYLKKTKELVPNCEAKVPFNKALENIEKFIQAKEIAEK
ncbi:hypothetical protein [Ornithinibacillus scapharcae]|uniref:hypothetical protein n=1 Tax=Ornithinibacillus scapharcae TaxID=1147159 RepID=UPI000225BDEE|nr:hypothetical protein [Ornithinibacillus scapharcae]